VTGEGGVSAAASARANHDELIISMAAKLCNSSKHVATAIIEEQQASIGGASISGHQVAYCCHCCQQLSIKQRMQRHHKRRREKISRSSAKPRRHISMYALARESVE